MTAESDPVAVIVKVIPNESAPGAYIVYVRCPFGCRRPHVHGGRPDAAGGYGHRVAHCASGPGRASGRGYVIRCGPAPGLDPSADRASEGEGGRS